MRCLVPAAGPAAEETPGGVGVMAPAPSLVARGALTGTRTAVGWGRARLTGTRAAVGWGRARPRTHAGSAASLGTGGGQGHF